MPDKPTTATSKDAPVATPADAPGTIGPGGEAYGDAVTTPDPIPEESTPSLVSPPGAEPIVPPDDPDAEPKSSQSQSSPPEESYESNTVAELKTELQARGLSTFGTKDELVGRLEADDADPATPPGNTTA